MLQIVERLQWLLSSQMEASCGPIGAMSEAEWQQYEARDEEIAELCARLRRRQ
jgi:FPC/CPF motif-containing protein YcgG